MQNVNAIPAKKIEGPVELPLLKESEETAYRSGDPNSGYKIICCQIGRHKLKKAAAYDFVMMANAAAQDGITLYINSAYRSWKDQNDLYVERLNEAVRLSKGPAAKPGNNSHQRGEAVDINTGFPIPLYQYAMKQNPVGPFNAVFQWLFDHAEDYGFNHVEGAKTSVMEPWHWVHPSDSIVGSAAFQRKTGFAVLTSEAAASVSAANQSSQGRIVRKGMYDVTGGTNRAISMMSSSRPELQQSVAVTAQQSSNDLTSQVSQAQAAILEVEPKGFGKADLAPFSYDFETGRWGDGKQV
jgi:hypothetical protein